MESLPQTPKELARWIDYTLLAPEATAREIEKLCAEARQFGLHGVCVNGSRLVPARHLLEPPGGYRPSSSSSRLRFGIIGLLV